MVGDLLQPTHLIFVLVIALLVLGPKRLPEVGRSLGRGMRDFKDALSSDDHPDALPAAMTAEPPPVPAPAPAAPAGAPAQAPAEPTEHLG